MKRESELLSEIEAEFQALLRARLNVVEYRGDGVPSDQDPILTLADADPRICYRMDTAVLFIDLRGSTAINLSVDQKSVVSLYQGFLRAMMQAATMYGGRVRNIVGDRIMVVFPVKNACSNAVRTAIFMNSIAQNIVDRHFKDTEIRAGIGVDFGTMVVSKVGLEISDQDKADYQNLVWLGRPANVASKLCDLANKKGAASMMYFNCDDQLFTMSKWQIPLHRFHETFTLHNSEMMTTKIRYNGYAVHNLTFHGAMEFSYPILITARAMDLARKDWQLDDSLHESKWPVVPALDQDWIGDQVLGGAVQWKRS